MLTVYGQIRRNLADVSHITMDCCRTPPSTQFRAAQSVPTALTCKLLTVVQTMPHRYCTRELCPLDGRGSVRVPGYGPGAIRPLCESTGRGTGRCAGELVSGVPPLCAGERSQVSLRQEWLRPHSRYCCTGGLRTGITGTRFFPNSHHVSRSLLRICGASVSPTSQPQAMTNGPLRKISTN